MTERFDGFKIATLSDVREHAEGLPVELWLMANGRTVVRCWNECGNNCTDLDLRDLLDWASSVAHMEETKDGGTATNPS